MQIYVSYASFVCESYASLNVSLYEIHMQVIGKQYPYMQVHSYMFRSIHLDPWQYIVYTNLCFMTIAYASVDYATIC